MVEAEAVTEIETPVEEKLPRIYEIGYNIVPTVKEENLEKIVGTIRAKIEKAGGSFIAEGAPSLTRLSYQMSTREGDKWVEYDRGYFGWLKFETGVETARALEEMLKGNVSVMRFIVFRTVREDTRAKYKAPTLREVKRTDTIKSTPRRGVSEESKGPVSEEELEKALKDITAE